MYPTNRADAMAQLSPYYQPTNRGNCNHKSLRFTTTSHCVECDRLDRTQTNTPRYYILVDNNEGIPVWWGPFKSISGAEHSRINTDSNQQKNHLIVFDKVVFDFADGNESHYSKEISTAV